MENEDYFFRLTQYLNEHERLRHCSRRGMCRTWSGAAREIIKEFATKNELHSWEIEVREVDIDICLSHTFLRLIAEGKIYLLDGTGVLNHTEYFGLESEAPEHLNNSHRDWIDHL